MKRFPANLSAEDQRFYRRWVRSLFLFYTAAIVVALGLTFMKDKRGEVRASNESRNVRLTTTMEPTTVSATAGAPDR